MAFRTLQGYMSLLLLLSGCLHFMTENRTAAISLREKCECIEETGSVQWRKITDYTIIPQDPLCNKVQIILQLSGKQVCLNPGSKQGEKLQRCWKRIKFNTQKKKVCLILKRKRNGPKSPKQH
ncbi:chemokine (C-X-C motif) ligand 18a, duplicate 1 [Siphateles boraxobius]|uniref:chemokine (C-X-C motif) ligand 18a, duplicate 1 n=1 Tax=Siphateles boraxobius TaxID=180520 RepID=UPI0040631313